MRGRAGQQGWCSLAVGRSGDPLVASGGFCGKRWRRGGGSDDLHVKPIERRKTRAEAAVT
jgi:hypothetical protein